MWSKRSELLAPLSTLTSDKNKWKWTDVEQTAFDKIKQVLSRETLLAFPNFDLPFTIHTDASKTQLGAVISQNNIPIAFYSRKSKSCSDQVHHYRKRTPFYCRNPLRILQYFAWTTHSYLYRS